MTDSILHRLAAGDMSAMQQCIDTYGGLVWSLARRFCPTAAEAEDAVQEVFIAVWESAGRFDETQGSEITFVAMITRRRLIDRGRKLERRNRLVREVKEAGKPPPPDKASDSIARVDEVARALKAMENLSDPQRRVLQLSIHRGFTHEQIAASTGMPLGTVKTHARRGLQRVRELLKPMKSDSAVEFSS